jgi:hypothetical protein
MSWLATIAGIEALEACRFESGLVHDLERRAAAAAMLPLVAATPSFQAYATSALEPCCSGAFPTFSVTGAACALDCDHCQAKILEPMIAATTPDDLDRMVREMAARQRLEGFLLSGGSNRRNEIRYDRYLPVIARLKRDMPRLRISVHTGLLDRQRAEAMADAGVDVAMMDVIGADETIRDVYHLDRATGDFESTLAALCETTMQVVPHIVIGLHRGRLVGERSALAMCARHGIDALVLVVVMPVYARPGFATPEPDEVAQFFLDARMRLPTKPIHLGCARPHGLHRRTVDAYAVMAGLDGIAFPAEGAHELAVAIGRPVERTHACCSVRRQGTDHVEATP